MIAKEDIRYLLPRPNHRGDTHGMIRKGSVIELAHDYGNGEIEVFWGDELILTWADNFDDLPEGCSVCPPSEPSIVEGNLDWGDDLPF